MAKNGGKAPLTMQVRTFPSQQCSISGFSSSASALRALDLKRFGSAAQGGRSIRQQPFAVRDAHLLLASFSCAAQVLVWDGDGRLLVWGQGWVNCMHLLGKEGVNPRGAHISGIMHGTL